MDRVATHTPHAIETIKQRYDGGTRFARYCAHPITTWDTVPSLAAQFRDQKDTSLLPIACEISQLCQQISSKESSFSQTNRGGRKGKRNVGQWVETNKQCSTALVMLILLNRYVTHMCCASLQSPASYTQAQQDIPLVYNYLRKQPQEETREDLYFHLNQIFGGYLKGRRALAQRLQEFHLCMGNTPLFLHLTSQPHLKREFTYVSGREVHSPWNRSQSCLLYASKYGCLAVLYHHSTLLAQLPLCGLVGVSLSRDASHEGLESPSFLKYFLEELGESSQIYLASAYSTAYQSFFIPFPLSKRDAMRLGPIQLPDGHDGLFLLWAPLSNCYHERWADIPDENGKRPPPLFTWAIVNESDTFFIRNDSSLFHDLEESYIRKDYMQEIDKIGEMVQQRIRQRDGEEEQEGACSTEQIFTKLEAIFSMFKENPAYLIQMQSLQKALPKYEALKKGHGQSMTSRETASEEKKLLDQLSILVGKLKNPLSPTYHLLSPEGYWTIYPTKHFRLLKNRAVMISPSLASTQETGGTTIPREPCSRSVTKDKGCEISVLIDALVAKTIIAQCESIMEKHRGLLLKDCVQEVSIYVPRSRIDKLLKDNLPGFEREIKTQMCELKRPALPEEKNLPMRAEESAEGPLSGETFSGGAATTPPADEEEGAVGGLPLEAREGELPFLPSNLVDSRDHSTGEEEEPEEEVLSKSDEGPLSGETSSGKAATTPPSDEEEGAVGSCPLEARGGELSLLSSDLVDSKKVTVQKKGAVGGPRSSPNKKGTKKSKTKKKSQPSREEVPENIRELLKKYPEASIRRQDSGAAHIQITMPGKGCRTVISRSKKESRKRSVLREKYLSRLDEWLSVRQ